MCRPQTEQSPVPVEELDRLTAGDSYAESVHRLLTGVRTQLRMQVRGRVRRVRPGAALRRRRPGRRRAAGRTALPLVLLPCARRTLPAAHPRASGACTTPHCWTTPAQPAGGPRSAGHWFDDAVRLGLREDLELVTVKAVLDLLDDVPPHLALAIDLGPQTLLTPRLGELQLEGRPRSRTVLEITEHAPVADDGGLSAVLRPSCNRGLRLAVDLAGAGYSSLRHVQPVLLEIDMALTRGADGDVVRRTLLTALAGFAHDTGYRLVAEGVETVDELHAVTSCGIQGYAPAAPSTRPAWRDDLACGDAPASSVKMVA